MARAGLCLALLLGGCGLVHKDVEISQAFTVGGRPPSDPQVDLATPLAASQGDLAHLSGVTLRAARIESTDGLDVGFVSGATLTLRANGSLPELQLATLPSPSGTTRADLVVDSSKDLKPYLQAGSLLTAKLTYAPTPTAARGLVLILTLRGSL